MSSLAWIDFDEAERQRAQRIIRDDRHSASSLEAGIVAAAGSRRMLERAARRTVRHLLGKDLAPDWVREFTARYLLGHLDVTAPRLAQSLSFVCARNSESG